MKYCCYLYVAPLSRVASSARADVRPHVVRARAAVKTGGGLALVVLVLAMLARETCN